ncbi:MAG: AraC family transcriptional regulator [Paracoccus denitrificans]|nr:MAG: AraC family transcriptional regulator [Paracoccus denitrificans]PZO82848.1 MAG: AraC family transcriptional regulator [Paracoccus denitrificans]
MTAPDRRSIPDFYLYGDPQADVERDFLHVEPILDRSGPNDWRIRPHFHPDHVQIMLIHHGGGTVRLEDARLTIPVPALIALPAGCVHQFDFQPGTDGFVVTAALGWLNTAQSVDPNVAQGIAQPGVYALTGSAFTVDAVLVSFQALAREFVWQAPARRAAIMALFTQILVILHRLGVDNAVRIAAPGDRDQDLLTDYRKLIEEHFRVQASPSFYAEQLAVTTARLNAACNLRAGRTASQILHDRMVLEAKRLLLYTDHSVSGIAQMIGFDDPAYFSRFFAKRTGTSPATYRKARSSG